MNKFRLSWPLVWLVAPMLLVGCRSPDIYYWGHYENLTYVMYAKPDKVPPEKQAEVMEADLQRAIAANKPVPPGFHAHLGYVYFQLGKLDLAQREFESEKKQFPESTVFMDRLLTNLVKK
ncbi:MAG: DUF4810 domain-containing protein [Verrucomicrobiia bacterium]